VSRWRPAFCSRGCCCCCCRGVAMLVLQNECSLYAAPLGMCMLDPTVLGGITLTCRQLEGVGLGRTSARALPALCHAPAYNACRSL
jgi:hypothetical protein